MTDSADQQNEGFPWVPFITRSPFSLGAEVDVIWYMTG